MKKKRESWDTNRTTARKARSAKFYCEHCDGCLVGSGQKCPRCKGRPSQKIDKKL